MRLFTAVEIPHDIRKKLRELTAKYVDKEPDAKFVDTDNLHITLKFFGEVNENKLDNLIDSLGKIKNRKFECVLEKVGAFPNTLHPKVVWVGVKAGFENLVSLYLETDKVTSLFKGELRPYSPHVTLLRCERLLNKKIFEENFISESFIVDSFVLMSSTLTDDGPVYFVVKRFKL